MKKSGSALLVLLAAPAPLLAQEGGLFAVDPGLSLWTIVVFLLVLFILGKYAWGPILGVVEAREDGIRESIDAAKKMQAEAQALLEENRKLLQAARRQSQEIVSEGRDAGERVRKEVEQSARQEAERILERARREIGREREIAIESIRREAVDLALAAASRILQERLDATADRELVERYLEKLSGEAAGSAVEA